MADDRDDYLYANSELSHEFAVRAQHVINSSSHCRLKHCSSSERIGEPMHVQHRPLGRESATPSCASVECALVRTLVRRILTSHLSGLSVRTRRRRRHPAALMVMDDAKDLTACSLSLYIYTYPREALNRMLQINLFNVDKVRPIGLDGSASTPWFQKPTETSHHRSMQIPGPRCMHVWVI